MQHRTLERRHGRVDESPIGLLAEWKLIAVRRKQRGHPEPPHEIQQAKLISILMIRSHPKRPGIAGAASEETLYRDRPTSTVNNDVGRPHNLKSRGKINWVANLVGTDQ